MVVWLCINQLFQNVCIFNFVTSTFMVWHSCSVLTWCCNVQIWLTDSVVYQYQIHCLCMCTILWEIVWWKQLTWNQFPDKWIGQRGPQEWSAWSLDLTLMDYVFPFERWKVFGVQKQIIFQRESHWPYWRRCRVYKERQDQNWTLTVSWLTGSIT